jgi:acetyl-CoA carboxylase biotin carboxylase subunit
MRLVASAEEMASAFEQAGGEAQRAFADGDIYIEKAILSPRHVEVQILADEHGQVIHLGERECSLQRRHQKVVEESPSPLLAERPEVREKLTAAAVRAAQAAGYHNAGTVEFLATAAGDFYFLEMNTRLQVEHPVTEMVTGLDLVKEQILIAAGEKLRYRQKDILFCGSAIECRVYAEDPDNRFFPSPGRLTALKEPSGPGVRVDSAAYEGWSVPLEYDPLIAKLVVWGPTRAEAIDRLRGALDEYHIGGIKTTVPFFREIVRDADFCRGNIDTGFIDRWLAKQAAAGGPQAELSEEEAVAVLAAGLHFLKQSRETKPASANGLSAWKLAGKRGMLRET